HKGFNGVGVGYLDRAAVRCRFIRQNLPHQILNLTHHAARHLFQPDDVRALYLGAQACPRAPPATPLVSDCQTRPIPIPVGGDAWMLNRSNSDNTARMAFLGSMQLG